MDVLQGQEEGVLSEKFTVAKREGRSSITGMCSVNLKFCIHLNLDYFLWHRSQSLFKTFFFFFRYPYISNAILSLPQRVD